jgi:hypothetical protein
MLDPPDWFGLEKSPSEIRYGPANAEHADTIAAAASAARK